MESVLIIAGTLIGIVIGFVIRKLLAEKDTVSKTDYEALSEKFRQLEQGNFHANKENEKLNEELLIVKNKNAEFQNIIQEQQAEIATQKERNNNLTAKNETLLDELNSLTHSREKLLETAQEYKSELSILKERNENFAASNEKLQTESEDNRAAMQEQAEALQMLKEEKAKLLATLNSLQDTHKTLREEYQKTKSSLEDYIEKFSQAKEYVTELHEQNKHLDEKLENERKDLENIKDKFANEFKVLADKILEEKTQKFTDQNKINIEGILMPLGKEIAEFKKKVEDTYTNEKAERYSLANEIKKLAEQNIRISEEAKNLTQALKGSAKQQGNWGEMILESILEHSGLQKNREYFVQDTLRDEDGSTIKSDSGRRMQPDIRIQYPGKGSIIIDSKVSLTAYERFAVSDDKELQEKALTEHIISIKKHIDELSEKKYHDFVEGTDFTMMFIPVEPAYMIAMQAEQDLWNYAYRKRILLISPTNLIAALKLVKDMWERKYQNDHALEIAERGGKLYDKFVNFTESLTEIGKSIEKSREAHEKAMSQLSTGRGNLIRQVEQLKELRVKTQKQISASLLENADSISLPEAKDDTEELDTV